MVAHRDVRDSLTDGDDSAGCLMAGDEGEDRAFELSVEHVNVRAAHSDGGDLYNDLFVASGRLGTTSQCEGPG